LTLAGSCRRSGPLAFPALVPAVLKRNQPLAWPQIVQVLVCRRTDPWPGPFVATCALLRSLGGASAWVSAEPFRASATSSGTSRRTRSETGPRNSSLTRASSVSGGPATARSVRRYRLALCRPAQSRESGAGQHRGLSRRTVHASGTEVPGRCDHHRQRDHPDCVLLNERTRKPVA
jgi:hypothetical protein